MLWFAGEKMLRLLQAVALSTDCHFNIGDAVAWSAECEARSKGVACSELIASSRLISIRLSVNEVAMAL